jgi:predicted small integral membrane protein
MVPTICYRAIVAWQAITMILCWWEQGAARLMRAFRLTAAAFHQAKRIAIVGVILIFVALPDSEQQP